MDDASIPKTGDISSEPDARDGAPVEFVAAGPISITPDLLQGLSVKLRASLGEASLTVGELSALRTGSVVTLQSGLSDFVDLTVNGVVIARGEIVAVGDRFGVRIVEIAAR